MRICLLPHFQPRQIGGVARHVLALRKHLALRGHEIVADPVQADLVHAHAAETTPVVDVYTNHGIHPMKPEMEPWKRQQNNAIFSNLKLAREVIAVSHWTADQWRHLVGREPHIIPNGIDLDEWRDVPRGMWRARLRVDERTPIVLWGKSRIDDVCDPTPALELALHCPDVLVVLTAPPKAFVHLPHNARAVGPQAFSAMQALLADCDVYLATTLENHSVQVLEAMALGKPVLGYDWGGTAETVQHEVSGLLVQPGHLDALAEAFREAYDHREELGAAGREIVAERYRWDRLIEQVEAVYEAALTEKLAEEDPHRPKASIVIPVYNKAPYVREAVESALRQQADFPYEVIVVDDGSTDGSAEILEQMAEEYPGLVVIHQENAGVAAARNHGIRLAMGRYICCLDADDMIDPLFLERTAAALDADPGLGIVYTDMLVFGDWPDRGRWQHVVRADEYEFERLKRRNFIPCCNLFRRVAWERAGGYKDINPSWEDYELWLNMGKLGWYGRRVPGPLFRYRKLYREGRDFESKGQEWLLRATINRLHRDLYPPMVSVVIPCYGQSRFLKEAIDSALAQSFPDIEVVVVDDGNEDEEAEAIRRIVAEYPAEDVRLIRHEENRGLATARNTGIEAARGTWIVPLDADDVIEPTFMEKCLRAVALDPRRFAYTDSLLWWPNEGREQLLKAHAYDFDELLRRITWPCTILYAKDAWRKVGGYKPEMSDVGGWEDWEFAISLGEVGVCGVRVPEPLFRYRQHSKTQMRYMAEERKERLRETLRRLHAAVYRGERPMGCCGRGVRTQPVNTAQAAANRDALAARANGDEVLVKYVGDHIGSMLWRAPSGRVYSFSAVDSLRWIPREDAEHFAGLPDFIIVPE